jgi:hypothetical protein
MNASSKVSSNEQLAVVGVEEALYDFRFDEIHCVMVVVKSVVKNTMPRLQMTSFFLNVR